MNSIRTNTPSLFFLVLVLFPFVLHGQDKLPRMLTYDFSRYEKTISDDEFHALYYDTLGYGNLAELAAQENVFILNYFWWHKIYITPIDDRNLFIERGIDWEVFYEIKHFEKFYVLDSTGHYVAPYYRVVFNPRKQAKLGKAMERYFALKREVESASENAIKYESKEYQQLKTKLQAAEKLVYRYMANYRLPIRKWNTQPPAWLYTE